MLQILNTPTATKLSNRSEKSAMAGKHPSQITGPQFLSPLQTEMADALRQSLRDHSRQPLSDRLRVLVELGLLSEDQYQQRIAEISACDAE